LIHVRQRPSGWYASLIRKDCANRDWRFGGRC
jgi:hypothetical protein